MTHNITITDADGNKERLKARSRHGAFTKVRALAIRRVGGPLRLSDYEAEAAYWRLHRITIRRAH